jgi:phage gpG-like protein
MASNFEKAPDFLAMAETLKVDAVRYAKVAGLNFFKDSFYNQGFTDVALEKWEGRKNDIDPGRNVLIKSTALLNSLEVVNNGNKITFFSDEVYADIHNNGGTMKIRVTQKSRKYFWFMFYKTKKQFWKNMALTRKDVMTVTIPQRKFLGESATFMADLDTWMLNTILKRFKTTL